MKMSGSIEIDRPVDAVFDYMSVPENNVKWETSALEMELTSEGPLGVGSTGRRVENNFGTDRGTWEITKYDPNEAIAMAFESGKFKGEGGWDFEAVDAGTRLTYWFRGDPKNPVFKLLVPVMGGMVRSRVNKDHTRLKELLESGA